MAPELTLHRYADPVSFLSRVEPFLLRHLATAGGLLKVLRQMRDAPHAGNASAYMATVEDRSDAVVAAAFRKPPAHLVLSTSPPEAIPLIAADFHSAQGRMAGFLGPAESVRRFRSNWRKISGQEAYRHESCRLYVLPTDAPSPSVSGFPRLARNADRDILIIWHQAMLKESAPHNHLPSIEFSEQTIDSWLNEKRDTVWLWLWEDNGQPVSIAGCFVDQWSVESACKLGFLYTPPKYRKCEYAQANLIALGNWAQASGLRIMPQNNIRVFPYKKPFPSFRRLDRAYRRLGLRPMYDMETYVCPASTGRK